MKKHKEKLNIVNEDDNIIGQDTRENIHKKGLLHREIWIFIYNKNLDILFQKRSPNKDTWPNKLDVSVGWHVDLGDDYEYTAIKELKEETGINAKNTDLLSLGKMKSKHYDPNTNTKNNVIRAVFAYRFDGKLKELKIEKGKATSLEFWSFKKLFHLSDEEKSRFILFDWEEQIFPFLKKIKELDMVIG